MASNNFRIIDRNGVIRHYLVFVNESDTGRSFTLNSTMGNIQVGNLHPFYTYGFSIAAVTVEAGPRSSSITLQTAEASEYRVWCFDFSNTILGCSLILHSSQWSSKEPCGSKCNI